MTAFKVCCIQSVREAVLAADAGATFVGLVGAMPSGQGPLPDGAIADIVAGVPPGVTPVLLTSRSEVAAIADHVRAAGVGAVQLVRTVVPDVRRRLRDLVPGLTILQVVHVEGPSSVALAEASERWADYLLLDSGRPSATVPELGGTGRVHDWSVSAEIAARSDIPVVLAGGLTPNNVARAVAEVRPWGVDVCSGLRDPGGQLVPERLSAFAGALEG